MNTWSSDFVPSVDVVAMKEDISFKMHDRVLKGYGLNPDHKFGETWFDAREASR